MAANLNQQIESTIKSFITEITALVRSAAVESVQFALGVGAPAHRRPGRPKGSGASKPAKAAKPGRRASRSSEDINATAAKFMAFVKANDGKRLEEISKALGIPSANLKLPVQKLLATRAVKTTGAKRGTKYHVGGGGRMAAKGAGKARKIVKAPKVKKTRKPGRAKGAKAARAAAMSATPKSAKVSRAKAAAPTKAQPAQVIA